MIKFGIDATWFELSYAKYSEPDVFAEGGSYTRAYNDYSSGYEDYYEEDFDLGIHQIDASMHVGPSVTVNPVGDLKVAAISIMCLLILWWSSMTASDTDMFPILRLVLLLPIKQFRSV
mgnify:CR=1 FL=1